MDIRFALEERTIFRLIRDVLVGYACGFEREADEFAATGDAGPVEEFVGGVGAGFLVGGHCCVVSGCS
jgi:hypothetical protein